MVKQSVRKSLGKSPGLCISKDSMKSESSSQFQRDPNGVRADYSGASYLDGIYH